MLGTKAWLVVGRNSILVWVLAMSSSRLIVKVLMLLVKNNRQDIQWFIFK